LTDLREALGAWEGITATGSHDNRNPLILGG
jgi:hypothetical protein